MTEDNKRETMLEIVKELISASFLFLGRCVMMERSLCPNFASQQCRDASIIKYLWKSDTLSFPCQTLLDFDEIMVFYVFEDGEFISDAHFRNWQISD